MSANFRRRFEKELREKLQQKSSSHSSEEGVLLKAFKYFDLNGSETVDFDEFIKVVEKVGIQVNDRESFEQIFRVYDQDGSGELDYPEFTSILFGNESATTRKMSPSRGSPSKAMNIGGGGSGGQDMIEQSLEKFRKKLASRGARGIIGLGKQFKIMDDDGSRNIDIYEFTKAVKDYRMGIPEQDIQNCFDAFDRDGSGTVDYDELLRGIRGPMNAFRKNLVKQAFAKIDRDGSGILDMEDIKDVYDAKNHPDVKAGKKTEDEILGEFLETFELHHSVTGGGVRDRSVTFEEFLEYYNNVSSSVDNDQYFELMMNNTWKLGDAAKYQYKKAWSNKDDTDTGSRPMSSYARKSAREPQRQQGSTPWGTDESRTNYMRSTDSYGQHDTAAKEKAAGFRGRGKGLVDESLVEKFRQKIRARGARGVIGLQRQFRIMDDDGSKSIDIYEFTKAVKDYRVDVPEESVRPLFRQFDTDNSGTISYDEFIRALRGPMNQFRRNIADKAFAKMDKDKSGVLDINDVRGVYNAKGHPDVKAGKKTEEEVIGEFLDTFEMHHAIRTGGGRDRSITKDEWLEYYNNISSSIEDDRYFELMMNNAWGLDGYKVKTGGWKGEY